MMTGKELFQKYMEHPPEKLPQFLQSLVERRESNGRGNDEAGTRSS